MISVSNIEESFVFDGGMKVSDARLHADDGGVESVKHPGSLDVKETESVVDIVRIAGLQQLIDKSGC